MIELVKAVFDNIICRICDVFGVSTEELKPDSCIINFKSWVYIDNTWWKHEFAQRGLDKYFEVKKVEHCKDGGQAIFRLKQIKFDDYIEGLYNLTKFEKL